MIPDILARAVLVNPSYIIPRLKSAFYKTYDYMLNVIERSVRAVYNGNIGGEFVDIMQSLITGQMTQAFVQAWEDSGETSHFLPAYLQDALQILIQNQSNFDFIYGYYKDIVDAKVDQTPIDPLLTRAQSWANQYDAAYNQAKLLIDTENGGNLIWRKGATENGCSTCADLDGLVMTAREWESLGLHPQGYPNPLLECEGGGPANNCECTLLPTDKRRSPKGYETALNIISRSKI